MKNYAYLKSIGLEEFPLNKKHCLSDQLSDWFSSYLTDLVFENSI